MDSVSASECMKVSDSIIITVGNTIYTIEHVYGGDRSIQEVMSDFLEREANNLDI